jgi:hypothetical protein
MNTDKASYGIWSVGWGPLVNDITRDEIAHLYAVLLGNTLLHFRQVHRISSVEDRLWLGLWLSSGVIGVSGAERWNELLSKTTGDDLADGDCTVTDEAAVSRDGLDSKPKLPNASSK